MIDKTDAEQDKSQRLRRKKFKSLKLDGNYMIDANKDHCIGIRLPDDVWQTIEELSLMEYRTKNATIVLLLRNAIKQPKIENLFLKILSKIDEISKNGGNTK